MAKILVVEDDPDIMRIMTHTLRAAGHVVIPAYGGEDALRKVKQHHPDLVLTDLAMPKMTGVEIIQQIKRDEATKTIPCLAVTAHVWEFLAHSAGDAGCDGYLAKPFTNRQLVEFVNKYLSASSGVDTAGGKNRSVIG
ncbi:Polar-differentiation response regulator DivK [bacterium HR30]|nr:Polar-differentiation response regulator DivK [bacterium HR30]